MTKGSQLPASLACESPATVADIRQLNACFDLLVARLDAQEEQKWLKTKEICRLFGCTDRHLRNLMAEGTICGDAVRNVGTIKRPEYRFSDVPKLVQLPLPELGHVVPIYPVLVSVLVNF